MSELNIISSAIKRDNSAYLYFYTLPPLARRFSKLFSPHRHPLNLHCDSVQLTQPWTMPKCHETCRRDHESTTRTNTSQLCRK